MRFLQETRQEAQSGKAKSEPTTRPAVSQEVLLGVCVVARLIYLLRPQHPNRS